MNIYIQGLRRSGTTILFNLFKFISDFQCYYEPLADVTKKTNHGGANFEHKGNLFSNVKDIRQVFIERNPGVTDSMLNYGAPQWPALEFEMSLPEFVKDYISSILSYDDNSCIKFTRMYNKLCDLSSIDQDALLIHAVRHPFAVVTSYIYGKNGVRRQRYLDEPSLFFEQRTEGKAWKFGTFSQYILDLEEYQHLENLADFEKVLLLWKYVNKKTYDDGIKYFGSRYRLIKNEDLRNDVALTWVNLMTSIGHDVEESTMEWAREHVHRGESSVHLITDPRWARAMEKLEMGALCSSFGY